jgi:hypothetical protein
MSSARRLSRRHPAEVTADRLGDHLDRWFARSDGATRDAIGRVRAWLDDIATADQARTLDPRMDLYLGKRAGRQ